MPRKPKGTNVRKTLKGPEWTMRRPESKQKWTWTQTGLARKRALQNAMAILSKHRQHPWIIANHSVLKVCGNFVRNPETRSIENARLILNAIAEIKKKRKDSPDQQMLFE